MAMHGCMIGDHAFRPVVFLSVLASAGFLVLALRHKLRSCVDGHL